MADDIDQATDKPDITAIAQTLLNLQQSPEALATWQRFFGTLTTEAIKNFVFLFTVFLTKAIGPIASGIGKGMNESEEALNELAADTLTAMFGTPISPSMLKARGGNGGAAARIGDAVLTQMGTASAPLEPSDANAKRLIAMSLNVAVQGWLQGFIFEIIGEAGTLGHIKPEAFAKITEDIEGALGLGRLARRVLQPYVDAIAIEPFRWKINQTYRPALLSPALAARQYWRQRWTIDQAKAELARQGYSDDRIEAIFNDSAKHLTPDDIAFMVRQGFADEKIATGLLADLGYDDVAAAQFLNLVQAKAEQALVDAYAGKVGDAWVEGFIDDAELQSWLSQSQSNTATRQIVLNILQSRKLTPRKRMSKADIEAAVTKNILSIADYREWLQQEGYDQKSALALELLLNETIQDKQAAARAKAVAETERAAAKAQKARDDAERKARLEADQGARSPSLADIRQAFVRGLVSVDRYALALDQAKYTPADEAFLIEVAQQDREAYAAQQARRDQAGATAAAKTLQLSTLDQLVLAGVFTLDEYATRLAGAGFSPDDAGALVALMRTKLANQADAAARRDAADVQLEGRGLSRADEERAVRKGIQTPAQYAAWLRAQGFSEGDAAILVATLQADLDAAADAQALADQVSATPKAKAISLDQLAAAVVAGLRSMADYTAALRSLGYNAADIDTLAALLVQKADDAAAAREKHDAAALATAAQPLSISQVERGVLLGTIDMDGYTEYLTRAGLPADDVALLVDNLAAAVQAQRAKETTRDAAAAQLADAGVSLADLETAYLDGAGSLDAYRAALLGRGIARADAEILVALLETRAAGQQDAADLAATVDAEVKTKGLTLSQWEMAVKDGTRTLADYAAFLSDQGYNLADVQVLATRAAQAIRPPAAS